MDLTFSIRDWAAWASGQGGVSGESPDISSIPPLLRRRLSPMGKAAVSVMLPLAQAYGPMPVVCCSRHGEVARTLEMLETLAEEELLSPTAFSLSVHNALGGLFSIHIKNRTPITAIAAGAEDLVPALLESVGQIPDAENILCVFYDEPLPGFYNSELPPTQSFAAAFVFTQGEQFALQASGVESPGLPQPQALQFAQFLSTPSVSRLTLDQWCIQRL